MIKDQVTYNIAVCSCYNCNIQSRNKLSLSHPILNHNTDILNWNSSIVLPWREILDEMILRVVLVAWAVFSSILQALLWVYWKIYSQLLWEYIFQFTPRRAWSFITVTTVDIVTNITTLTSVTSPITFTGVATVTTVDTATTAISVTTFTTFKAVTTVTVLTNVTSATTLVNITSITTVTTVTTGRLRGYRELKISCYFGWGKGGLVYSNMQWDNIESNT